MRLSQEEQAERFEEYMALLLQLEGGYVNDPQDPGGETNYGITKRVALKSGYEGSMRMMPKEVAIEIYRKHYWANTILPHLHNGVALPLFIATVHSGYTQAIKILQRALGVVADGVVGVESLNALSNAHPRKLIEDFHWAMMGFYIEISPKTSWRYTKGWFNRLQKIREVTDA